MLKKSLRGCLFDSWCVFAAVGSVIQTLAEGQPVWGVTSLDNLIYVLRANKSSEQLEVFDVDSYRLMLKKTVPALGAPYDIVACGHSRCAYISDALLESVHKVVLPSTEVTVQDARARSLTDILLMNVSAHKMVFFEAAVTQWPVNDVPACLSLTAKHSVLVACREVRKIKEFAADGQLLGEVELPQDVCTPFHTVQLSSGKFLVCHGEKSDDPLGLHRVCLVDSGGQVVKSYGGRVGSGSRQINMPLHMAVDGNEFVFVADTVNGRVILLSPTLTYICDAVSREQLTLPPVRLSVDIKRRRLYIAVNEYKDSTHTAGQVLVVNV